MQELGESIDAQIKDIEKHIENFLNANANRHEKYWIVLAAKNSHCSVLGRPAITQVIKAYTEKPQSMIGVIVGEVDNKEGTIKWEVNMPDIPFEERLLPNLKPYYGRDDTIIGSTTVGSHYLYNG